MESNDFVYIAYNEWSGPWRGDQQISKQLSKNFRIIYCNPSKWLWDEGFKVLKPKSGRSEKSISVVDNIFYLPFTRLSKPLMRFSYRLFANKLINKFSLKNPVLWVNSPIYPPMLEVLIESLKPSLVCFRWSDNWAEFPNSLVSKQIITDNCEYIIKRSDVVFTVSQQLFSLASKIKKEHVYMLSNGVNEEVLSRVHSKDNLATKIDNISKPVFCYIGTINQRIKFEWIEKAASENLSWKFVFIGPVMKSFKIPDGLSKSKNIFFVGETNFEDLPAYLKKADVFLLLHNKTAATLAMDPIKLYEYLFTGKPVVCTDIVDKKFERYVYIAQNYDQFFENCKMALEERDASLAAGRKKIAMENTWQKRADTITDVLDNFKAEGHQKIKTNILFYESSSGFGGSANTLANIINNLNRALYQPIVIIKNSGPQIERIRDAEIIKLKDYKEPAKASSFIYSVFFIKNILPESLRIYSIIKRKNISFVHINTNILLGIPAILAAKLANIPCVCHIRDTRGLIKRERFFANLVKMFIILNKDAYEIYTKDIPAEKINVIYDGIDTDIKGLVGNFKKELSFNSDPLIGAIGRIIEGKGQKEFILAAKEVLKTRPQAKFILAGEAKGDNGDYFEEVKNLVRDGNLEKNIIFTGWRNDINNIISDLDILVQSTTTFAEGFGLTCVEAMVLKKPVVATKVTGPSDIVVDGETGFLVPPGDIKAMAEKIIYLLDNPQMAKKMGEAGRDRAIELFNIKNQVKKIEAVYKQVLNK